MTNALALAGVGTFRNQIMHCKAETLLKSLPDDSIDMILTSPPYDNLRTYKGFEWDFEYIAQQSYRVLKPGGVLVWVVGDATVNGSETLTSFKQAIYFREQAGFNLWQTLIWDKPGTHPNQMIRYPKMHEYMYVFSKGSPKTFNVQKKPNKHAGETRKHIKRQRGGNVEKYGSGTIAKDGALTSVWSIATGYMVATPDKDAYAHHAIFPDLLAERHIHTWSNPGDLVLDYFAGSGTTLKMARNLKRHYIGCDISQDYVDLIHDRLRLPFEKRKRQPKSEPLDTLPLFAGFPPVSVPAESG